MKNDKHFLKSKTMWINVLLFISGITLAVADNLQAGGALTLTAIANMVLRSISKTNITL